MQQWDMAIIVTIDAENYEEAKAAADVISAELSASGEFEAFTPHYEHDNEGQRVVYLHNEDTPE